jgi:uncharacterized protein with GYD domain
VTAYIILSKIGPEVFKDPPDFRKRDEKIEQAIKKECPGVKWKASYATLGRFDVVDIVEADDYHQVARATLIIRGLGNATTETMLATPWSEFLDELK